MKSKTKAQRFIIWIANILGVHVSTQCWNQNKIFLPEKSVSPKTYKYSQLEILGKDRDVIIREAESTISRLIAKEIFSDPENFIETHQTMYMNNYPKKIEFKCKIVIIKPEDEGKQNFIDYDQECF